jgi:hypothetical protein
MRALETQIGNSVLDSIPKLRHCQEERMGARKGGAFLFALAIFVLSAAAPELYAAQKTSLELSRDSIIRIVTQIQRADYEGDRSALKRLHGELTPVPADNKLASRVLYWRGFALWRSAINGFNESPTPNDLEEDLAQAVTDFKDAIARDPAFVEPKIGAGSSLGYLMYLHRNDPARVQELLQQSSPLLKEAMAAAPDNPRLLWVLGPIRWSSPPERGGGQDKAFECYNKGLAAVRNQKRDASDPLEPSWGEPELLMSLAWSNLNRSTPDLNAAERDAQAALKLVPYWHYVRDILMPQIRAAQAKALLPVAGSALPQVAPSCPATEQALRAVDHQLWLAFRNRDAAMLDKLLDDNFIGTNDGGEREEKSEVLAHIKAPQGNIHVEVDEQPGDFRVVSANGVVIFNVTRHWTDHDDKAGVSWGATSRTSFVLTCSSGVWKILAYQETGMPNKNREPSRSAIPHLDDYVGHYRLGENGDKGNLTVMRKGDHLVDTWEGEDPVELFPGKYDTFFNRDDDWVERFLRDPSGKVTGILYTNSDGELEAKRVP